MLIVGVINSKEEATEISFIAKVLQTSIRIQDLNKGLTRCL